MSRNTETPFVVFSAERHELPAEQNGARHDFLVRQLSAAGLSFDASLRGRYKGSQERSILVLIPEGDGSQEFSTVLRIARAFQQESVLYVDGEREACLRYLDGEGRWEHIGHWSRVSEAEAQARDSYTEARGAFYAVA